MAGIALELAGLLTFLWNGVLIIREFNSGADFWRSQAFSVVGLGVSFAGYVLKRWARKEPIFQRL